MPQEVLIKGSLPETVILITKHFWLKVKYGEVDKCRYKF